MAASRGAAPSEVMAPPADQHAYEDWRKADTLRAPYKVASAFLRGIRGDAVESAVECPLLCFVNVRSGGQMGAQLALLLSQAVGRVQVFDIGDKDYRPDKVLPRFYDNLRALEAAGDPRAPVVRQRLRILVCGGDGTIAWVMGVIRKLRVTPEPPIAIMPLGTGNDLSRSFGWGEAYSRSWLQNHQAMYDTLNRIATSAEDRLDCWAITVTAPRRAMFREGLPHCLAPPQLPTPSLPAGLQTSHGRASVPAPASSSIAAVSAPGYGRGQSSSLNAIAGLHSSVRGGGGGGGGGEGSTAVSVVATLGSATPLQNIATSSVGSAVTTFTTATNMSMHTGAAQAGTSVPPTIVSGAVSTSADEETSIGVAGGHFWNYFSVGLDAKAAWGFHSLREERPGLTSSRLANQFWYTFFSCTSGWFCCAQPVNMKVTLEVLRPAGEAAGWQPVKLPSNVKALIVLNLQSYAGGRNLWGPLTTAKDEKKHGYTKPTYNDGLLEVVGLRSGWHTGAVMGSKGSLVHARRICQAAGVRLAVSAPYVRADGEPSHCYMQIDGEPWKQDVPVRGQEAPVRVEIVHAGVSRVLRNEPAKSALSFISRGPSRGGGSGKSTSRSARPRPLGPIVAAVSEPGPTAGVVASPTPSSIQLPVPQSAPQVGVTASFASGATVSGSGVLPHPTAHGSQSMSGMGQSTWARIGLAGRPSTASIAGSSSAAGIEPLTAVEEGGGDSGGGICGSGGGAAVGVRGALPTMAAAAKHGDAPAGGVADGGGADGGGGGVPLGGGGDSSFLPPNEAPTPRTLSTDLGSQGGRSTALQE